MQRGRRKTTCKVEAPQNVDIRTSYKNRIKQGSKRIGILFYLVTTHICVQPVKISVNFGQCKKVKREESRPRLKLRIFLIVTNY